MRGRSMQVLEFVATGKTMVASSDHRISSKIGKDLKIIHLDLTGVLKWAWIDMGKSRLEW
ncbi:hypothetical protein SAY86_014222 [Trapa natans]|uniref:Uncharacterized protein n=1 Tax=Trapa natans TaxID=22666 RepID=A0AAN7L0Q5_TRANT|nr:hypothetical protein SAY86_014222 [Trapa natans]